LSLFSGLIFCQRCGSRYKPKKERGKQKYICQNYDLNGSEYCVRNVIEEELLSEFVKKHFPFQKISDEEAINSIERIEVLSNNEFSIYYKDGSMGQKGNNFFRYL
jgi:hypothetical protein